MPQLCTKCSRANPPEAVYCHFDGFVLGGHERRGGPVSVGSQPFSNPFVFPTGRTCRSFDELALACQEEWSVACGLLREGYLESFFRGLGRVDLARAAKEAAQFPDAERGLDQVLEKIPSTVLDEPKLRVDPVEVNLGVLDSPKERTFPLELENTGGRLLYGTVSSSESAWISIGDAGATEKHFQFTHEARIPVHIKPDRVRASKKPVEARILVESNGGTVTVVLKAEKAIKPFPSGPFKGAKTPREVAKLAMEKPKEVAPLFESGEVEKWYDSNGWIYPVKTPAASGLAAIQQFFEALGVTKPPKVEIDQREFSLQADPGDTIPLVIEVSTQEKKAAWAHATSNVPWLEVSKAKCSGRTATINMTIPAVPDRPGELLEGELTVIGNGNHRWVVPVRIEVSGTAAAVAETGNAFDFDAPAPPPPRPKSTPEITAARKSSPDVTAEPRKPPPPPLPPAKRKPAGPGVLLHAIPAALLGLAVLGVVGFDLFAKKGGAGGGNRDPEGWNYDIKALRDKEPRVGVQFNPESRFGVVMIDPADPKGTHKKLTASPLGDSNNTVVKIGGDNDGYVFGITTDSNVYVGQRRAPLPAPRRGWVTKMRFRREQILCTQHVEIVPGKTSLLDTCLVYYTLKNEGTVAQTVGLRVMLDTYIGENDGVPFTIPGEKGFVTKQRLLEDDQIPDYVEVVENPDDATNPGTTARLALKGIRLPGIELTEPKELVICRFINSNVRWKFPREDMKAEGDKKGDSCVAVYWPEEKLDAGQTRHMAFTYGLGELDIGDRLALSVPASVAPGRDFVVTCYVYDAKKGQKVALELPEGLSFAGGDAMEKTVEQEGGRTQVFWKVRAAKDGTYSITATSGKGRSRDTKVVVKAVGLFG